MGARNWQTLSMPMAFMTRATPSSGVLSTSGSPCCGKLSLKCADEYSLTNKTSQKVRSGCTKSCTCMLALHEKRRQN